VPWPLLCCRRRCCCRGAVAATMAAQQGRRWRRGIIDMMKPGSRLGRGGARGAAFWSGRMHGRRKQRLLGARPNERAAARTATSGNERRARTCSSVVLALSSAPIWAHSSALVALWWRALGRQERPTGRCSWAARAPDHWLATGWPLAGHWLATTCRWPGAPRLEALKTMDQ